MNLILFLCLLAPSAFAVGDNTPSFITQPRDQIVRAGATVTLYCSVSNAVDGRFMWVRDEQVISQNYEITVPQDPERFALQGINGVYNLIISNAKPEDSGSYRCMMITRGGPGIMSNLGRVVVESPPAQDYPTCKSSETTEVAVGETIQISCTVQGGSPPAILTIHKNDLAMESYQILDGAAYAWTVREEDDGAHFSCVGKHVFWTDPRTCRLGPYRVISESPSVVLIPREMETIVGAAASFVCSASNAPRVHYRWFIDESEIFDGAENGRFVIEHAGTASILQILGTFEKDTGRVLCNVVAATGQILGESNLSVMPYIAEVPEDLPITGPPRKPIVTDMINGGGENPDQAPPESEAPKAYSAATLPIILGSVGAGVLVLVFVIMGIVLFLAKSYQDGRSGKATPQIDPQAQEDDVTYRSRYVSVVKSWLFPVHSSTQSGVAAFGVDNPNPNVGKDFETPME